MLNYCRIVRILYVIDVTLSSLYALLFGGI